MVNSSPLLPGAKDRPHLAHVDGGGQPAIGELVDVIGDEPAEYIAFAELGGLGQRVQQVGSGPQMRPAKGLDFEAQPGSGAGDRQGPSAPGYHPLEPTAEVDQGIGLVVDGEPKGATDKR